MSATTTQEASLGDRDSGEKAGSSRFTDPRLQREWRTMAAMVRIFCKSRHGGSPDLCDACRDLLGYATLRLERCRFGPEKPTCANCPVHCYQRERREQIRKVMIFAGPRMLWTHPVLSLYHWLDGRRRPPALPAP